MKDPCIAREQSSNIHDVVKDQGFAMDRRAISNTVNHLFSHGHVKTKPYRQSKVWIDFFSYVEC